MHRFAVKSNLVDSSSVSTTSKLGFAAEEKPICPKPRRLGVPPEFLKPLPRCVKHSQSNAEERSHIFALIDDAKTQEQSGKEWELEGFAGCCCCCCSPTCLYSGSPPTRTDNALVHDVHFVHQMELVSPFMRTKLSDRFGFASPSPI
ncbi:hypothetical protein NE237_017502 [Protea cynaroides]|uniref:Uncharacterized protein n=1 Tax=Protea cynaroides TaxID=273540 RepID=A0A9Q0QN33_9MAGN|nr:hypothetical protein NE237_017502 [Protea cynaroides]